jgi:hypothetical protein
MKGTLFSCDFVETLDGTPKFLEMNTDTVVYSDFLESHISWDELTTVISNNSLDTVEVVYKPEIHSNVVEHLSQSLHTANIGVTTFTKHAEQLNDIYPTPITDASNKFILRLAYDENAIVDSTYAKGDIFALNLFNEYTASTDAVPYYFSSSEDDTPTVDNLDYVLNESTVVPDLIVKGTYSTNNRYMQLWKIGRLGTTSSFDDRSRIESFFGLETGHDDYNSLMVQKYCISSESIDNGVATSLRYYGIVYGSDLEILNLGEYRRRPILDIPTQAQFDDGNDADSRNDYRLPQYHYYEFSTSTLSKVAQRGVYESETIVKQDGTNIDVTALETGSWVRSFDLKTLPDASSVSAENYFGWSHPGRTLPTGSAVTSSLVVSIEPKEVGAYAIAKILVSGSDEIYASPASSMLLYNTSSDDMRFKRLSDIDVDNDFAIGTTNNEIIPITSIDYIILKENSGSLYDINVEEIDNFFIGDVSYFSGIFHNYK